jgi:hypothetical protein
MVDEDEVILVTMMYGPPMTSAYSTRIQDSDAFLI